MTTMAEYLDDISSPSGADFLACKTYLGVPDAENDRLELWLAAAVSAADNYMGKDFVDSDGNDIDPPGDTLLGVYAFIDALRDDYNRAAGVIEKKTFQETEKYAAGASYSGAAAAYRAAIPYWYPWKEDVSLAGAI